MQGSQALVHHFHDVFKNYSCPSHHQVTLCVPYIYMHAMKNLFSLGAQDCSPYSTGSHTGEVSAGMLKDMGATSVLIGHSERRRDYYESTPLLLEKCKALKTQNLTPVICLGESYDDYQQGLTLKRIHEQLTPFLACSSPKIFAYEPLWAIGTGKTATRQDLEPVFRYLKTMTSVPLLYGGSVGADNVQTLLSIPFIDGVLVGGASLDPYTWKAILESSL